MCIDCRRTWEQNQPARPPREPACRETRALLLACCCTCVAFVGLFVICMKPAARCAIERSARGAAIVLLHHKNRVCACSVSCVYCVQHTNTHTRKRCQMMVVLGARRLYARTTTDTDTDDDDVQTGWYHSHTILYLQLAPSTSHTTLYRHTHTRETIKHVKANKNRCIHFAWDVYVDLSACLFRDLMGKWGKEAKENCAYACIVYRYILVVVWVWMNV